VLDQTEFKTSGTSDFSVITGTTIAAILQQSFEECVDVVRDAYIAHAANRSVNPPSVFLRFPDKPNARIIGLPTHLHEPWSVSGIKWIASFPDNVNRGIPRASAALIINNHDTGYPIACLEGSIVSAVRTAASAALAASYLSSRGRVAKTLAIIGTGFIARYVYQFLIGCGWRLDNVRLYDLDPTRAEHFAQTVCEGEAHASVTVARDLASALDQAELVLFTTVASNPYVHDSRLLSHNPLILHVSLRDLAPELMLDACNIVDDVDHVMTSDTSLHLAQKLSGRTDFVAGTLVDVMQHRCAPDFTRPVIFSPFGLGVLDLAIGKRVYDLAVTAKKNVVIDGFFCDLER
jgi:N-[(2S)-2-amino-2-carboxyethyl]-L-glutamate dehydrogenase